MRIAHPSLEGVILKPSKAFPGAHFQKSALQGRPRHCEALVSCGELSRPLHTAPSLVPGVPVSAARL